MVWAVSQPPAVFHRYTAKPVLHLWSHEKNFLFLRKSTWRRIFSHTIRDWKANPRHWIPQFLSKVETGKWEGSTKRMSGKLRNNRMKVMEKSWGGKPTSLGTSLGEGASVLHEEQWVMSRGSRLAGFGMCYVQTEIGFCLGLFVGFVFVFVLWVSEIPG